MQIFCSLKIQGSWKSSEVAKTPDRINPCGIFSAPSLTPAHIRQCKAGKRSHTQQDIDQSLPTPQTHQFSSKLQTLRLLLALDSPTFQNCLTATVTALKLTTGISQPAPQLSCAFISTASFSKTPYATALRPLRPQSCRLPIGTRLWTTRWDLSRLSVGCLMVLGPYTARLESGEFFFFLS